MLECREKATGKMKNRPNVWKVDFGSRMTLGRALHADGCFVAAGIGPDPWQLFYV